MSKTSSSPRPYFLILTMLAMGPSSLAFGENASDEISRAEWTRLNQYSPIDAFQSKGSYGWHVGIGGLSSNETDSEDEEKLVTAEREREKTVPRVFLNRGTAWPVDIGLAASYFQKTSATQWGGHLQWTIFESFQLPSVALRYSHINLSKMEELERLATDTLQIGLSYGFLRYITLSVNAGIQQEKGRTRPFESSELTLTQEETKAWTTKRTIYGWGVNLVPFTPFIQLGFEQVYWDGSAQTSMGKVSFLL